jgi:hypothetical protein
VSTNDGMLIDPNMGMTEFEKIKHDQGLLLDAKIHRHESTGDTVRRANQALEETAKFIQLHSPEAKVLKSMKYMGSAAVHCYHSEVLQQTFFISQTDPMSRNAPEPMAGAAMSDLRKQLMSSYGRRPEKKRSGF